MLSRLIVGLIPGSLPSAQVTTHQAADHPPLGGSGEPPSRPPYGCLSTSWGDHRGRRRRGHTGRSRHGPGMPTSESAAERASYQCRRAMCRAPVAAASFSRSSGGGCSTQSHLRSAATLRRLAVRIVDVLVGFPLVARSAEGLEVLPTARRPTRFLREYVVLPQAWAAAASTVEAAILIEAKDLLFTLWRDGHSPEHRGRL